ncbi:Autotransporter [Yersinia aldovae ATCC 35236]|nr:Autotransporter [Yersinia aldovae ATCC 35236]
MNKNIRKTYLSVAISSIIYTSSSISANAVPCVGYVVTGICEQTKSGEGEFHSISLGDGVITGTEDNHFIFNGEGYKLYYPHDHFSAAIALGTIRYTEVNNSTFTITGTHYQGGPTYEGRAENTTLNNSLMWVMTSADQTIAKGNSAIIVSTQFAMNGSTYTETKEDDSIEFDPYITNSRYQDTSYEMLWGMKKRPKTGIPKPHPMTQNLLTPADRSLRLMAIVLMRNFTTKLINVLMILALSALQPLMALLIRISIPAVNHITPPYLIRPILGCAPEQN